MRVRARTLLLLLTMCQGESGRKSQHHGKGSKRRQAGKHSVAQAQQTPAQEDFAVLSADSLWRIKMIQSGGSLYAGARGRIVVSQRFFTLFRACPLGSGAYKLEQYPSGRVVYHLPSNSKQALNEGLTRVLSDTEDYSQLMLLPPVQTKRRVHSNLMGGSMYEATASPPPPLPMTEQEAAAAVYRAKEIHEVFFPVLQSDGTVAFRVGTKGNTFYLHETSNSTFEVVDVDPKRRGRQHALGSSARFRLQQVSSHIPFAEPIGGTSERHVSTRRIKQSAFQMGGREVVVLTACNVGTLDLMPYFWGWLNVSGVRRFMHLDTDGLACTSARALNEQLSQIMTVDCVSCRELTWPGGTAPRSLASNKISHWGTYACLAAEACAPRSQLHVWTVPSAQRPTQTPIRAAVCADASCGSWSWY